MRGRLYYLDILRGIASLVVACFYHFVHFSDKFQPNSDGHLPPFYFLIPIRFLYDRGDLMVDVFFVISGIVFSYTYGESIYLKKVDKLGFFTKRFSRLYPIHLLTLLITACIVNIFYESYKTYPIYKQNDLYHFFLNVIFLQRGFADSGYSFNGPAWSLSIEMFMYIIFFIYARYVKSIFTLIVLVLIGILIFRFLPHYSPLLINIDVSRGLIGFFSGCLLYELILKNDFEFLHQYVILPILSILYFVYLVWLSHYLNIPTNMQVIFVLFVTIPYIHHSKIVRQKTNVSWLLSLGDVSLAVYLIHVPIQMAIIWYYQTNEKIIPYSSPFFLSGYVCLVIIVGYFLHYRFEKPLQSMIQKYKNSNMINV